MTEAAPQISPPYRELNGRRQRESTAQDRLNELARAQADAETALVRSQPHRLGESSPMAESAIGRFVLQYALPRELFEAAMNYARVRGMWLSAMGAPRDERHGGNGGDLPMETVWKWRDDVSEWRKAMGDAGGKDGAAAIELMVCDNLDLTPNYDRLSAISALTALGKIMGKI